ncbi:MAG TPA: NADH-quinone oxidoreductase subunit NuoH [Dehalococcoidia bacterium]|nr:NADH-quinone oxidoreductase subunit NuoH [Dehalococcoidia bacterium]
MNHWYYFVDLFAKVRTTFVEWLQSFDLPSSLIIFLDSLIGITLILMIVFPIVMVFIWTERRFVARFQLRPGPNRCGPLGLLQPVADAVKILMKELIMPAKGDKIVHWLAPVVLFIAALMVFAVFPIGKGEMGAFSDLNIGILYVVAIGSLGVLAIFMAGWASNNKYSLIGAMRGVAQLISYEVPMVLSIVGVVLIVGSLQMSEIVGKQTVPFILLQPLGFLIYFIGALTELNRTPMDMIEADSELTAGYFTEYSGMKFAMFFLGEYINTLAASILVTTLFLSGWKGPFLPVWFWFIIKIFAVFMFILWMRATLIRLRIDQVMAFSWKFLLPMALINIFVTALEVLAWEQWMSGWESFPWPFIFVNFAVAGVLILIWAKLFFKTGGGRIEVGGYRTRYSQGYGVNPQAPV